MFRRRDADACETDFEKVDDVLDGKEVLQTVEADAGTQVFDGPVSGRILFEEIIRENLDTGRVIRGVEEIIADHRQVLDLAAARGINSVRLETWLNWSGFDVDGAPESLKIAVGLWKSAGRRRMRSSDGKTRSVVMDMPGAGWDYSIARHPYHEHERPKGARYCVYNRRLMAVCFDDHTTEEGYWRLRRQAAVLHTGEYVLEFRGPDAEALLDKLFTKDISKVKAGRCGYGLACYDDGGLLVDGILLRLAEDRFWYAQADGDFCSWARAHATGLDVSITDPDVFVSQVQGPSSLKILEAAAGGLPENFTYFACTRVKLGGQDVVVTRTGYTNELGWEFYTEPHHDPEALWAHLQKAGADFGMEIIGLDAMNIRRIEAGILNAGSDFNETTTPYAVGLGRFVDAGKADFIGKAALQAADKGRRSHGIKCPDGEPLISGAVYVNGSSAGVITAGATSPFLGHGIGIALMHSSDHGPGTSIEVHCRDGSRLTGELVELPMYDQACAIPRGKLVDVPE